jgi:hypothetical protein
MSKLLLMLPSVIGRPAAVAGSLHVPSWALEAKFTDSIEEQIEHNVMDLLDFHVLSTDTRSNLSEVLKFPVVWPLRH